MKISKSLQRQYLNLIKESRIEEFLLLSTGNEPFNPMYLVSHGFLNAEVALSLKEEVIEKTHPRWNLTFEYKEKNFFIWLVELHHKTGTFKFNSVILWFLKHAFEELGERSWDYLVKSLIRNSPLSFIKINYKEYILKIPSAVLEANGQNPFMWNIRHGADVSRIKEIYQPGDEFLKDHKGNKVLCFLPDSKQELRKFFFENTKIAEDPEFTSLGIKIQSNYYLTRPYQGIIFPVGNDLKKSLGVSSKLIVETLREKCTFSMSPSSEAKELTLDYFNAIYILKNKLPQVDENVLHNALKEVVNRNVKHLALNIESLEDIIELTWNELSCYSEKRRLKMLLSNYSSLSSIKDMLSMIKSKAEVAQELKLKLLPDKPKSFMDIHNHLQRIPELLLDNREFEQDFFLALDSFCLDNFEISFPKSENELIVIGVDLNICVGSEHYRELVFKKQSQIFTIKESGVLKACVEIKTFFSCHGRHVSVEQISGFQNKVLDKRFNNFVYEAFRKKLPDVFVSFPSRFPNEQDYHYE